jgi:integrase
MRFDQWLVPALGPVRLEALKPVAIQRWGNKATQAGASEKVRLAHTVLRSALKWAMAQRQLTFNPAVLVKVPRPVHRRASPLTPDQARKLLDFAGDHRLGGMFVLSLTTGLRIGEVSGLNWADVDVTRGVLRVRQQVQALGKGIITLAPLKTASSRRTPSLPALAVEALKTRRKAQLEERLRAGSDWEGADDLVFTNQQGRMVHLTTVRDVLRETLKSAGLDKVKFHTLRHTAATLLLTDGTPLFDVSRILGHAQMSTTADVYGHLVPQMTAGAASRMDALLKAKA